jgi:pimeloyl-ACP methyl ester carboxylesterase
VFLSPLSNQNYLLHIHSRRLKTNTEATFPLFFYMIPKQIINTLRINNRLITYTYRAPAHPKNTTLCFIPGFRSDFITSKKALMVHEYSMQQGFGFLSWNHSNQASSVVDWYQDGLSLIQRYDHTNLYVIGASMGLWIALLISTQIKLSAIMGIGGGIDFTERWLNEEVPLQHQQDMDYIWKRPSEYDPSGFYDIAVSFLIKSRPALLLSNQKDLQIQCQNVYLIHGTLDQDVPIQNVKHYHDYLTGLLCNVSVFEISDGNHQLSRSQDLQAIIQQIKTMVH